MKKSKFSKSLLISFSVLAVLTVTILCLAISAVGIDSVTIIDNGTRLKAKCEGGNASEYKWYVSDTVDGEYQLIEGATKSYYDINVSDDNKYIKVVADDKESVPFGPVGKLVVFDISNGNVTLGKTYSGKASDGTSVKGTHMASNNYLIMQSNPEMSGYIISFTDHLPSEEFDVTLSGINIGAEPTNFNQSPGTSGSGTPTAGYISIPATTGAEKHVVLRLKGENSVRNITYYSGGDTNYYQPGQKSSLKITSINGDGATDGGSLYIPKKVATEDIDAFVATKTNYNHWNAAIGGTDSSSQVQNFEIAGGKLQVLTTLGDNCTAIGAGGNGYCDITISGGDIVAHCNGTGTAIGGGIGWNAAGGGSEIKITGGKIYAKNHAQIDSDKGTVGGVAIGSGSSFASSGTSSTISITGGSIEAYGTFGNGIGGGNSSSSTGGGATVTLSNCTVIATSIGGGNSEKGVAGSAEVTVDGTADVTLINGIGGGLSKSGNGGAATITVNSGKLTCGATIGGGTGNLQGNGGNATVTVNGGTLISTAIGGGLGGSGGNGGAAIIEVNGGVIETGSIGGGATVNPDGSIGYAKATITGGEVIGQILMAAGGTERCEFIMSGGVLRSVNTSNSMYTKKDGAAVYMNDPDGYAKMSGGIIKDCYAENGGAIYMTDGEFILSGDAKITNCHSSGSGGAIYLGGGIMTIVGGTIDNCAAGQNGGAVYLGGTDGKFTMNGGVISHNSALNNGGGAYVSGANTFILGGMVNQNVAQNNGGGIAVYNGNVVMGGGSIDDNSAISGSGGGIYVSATDIDVDVDIYSGSIINNDANKNGGAIAVFGTSGNSGSNKNVNITIGANLEHVLDNNEIIDVKEHIHDVDGDGNDEDDLKLSHETCPVIQNNVCKENGGAIYITGSNDGTTNMNMYCLIESGNNAESDDLGDFMKIQGGRVTLSSKSPDDPDANNYGNIHIDNTIFVAAGQVKIMGSMQSVQTKDVITVDIKKEDDSFADNRENEEVDPDTPEDEKPVEYFTVEYFESFQESGLYASVMRVKDGTYKIEPAMWTHPGWVNIGWRDADGNYYNVNEPYNGEKGDILRLWADWQITGYTVDYRPLKTISEGAVITGESKIFDYLSSDDFQPEANWFGYPGYEFVCWEDAHGNKYYIDQVYDALSEIDGDSFIFYAVWEKCEHNMDILTYSLTAPNVITCNCRCGGHGYDIIISADTVTYNGSKHEAYLNEKGIELGLQITYTKSGDSAEPINAGVYEACFTYEGVTAKCDLVIEKSAQPDPDKPTFTIKNENELIVTPITSPVGTEVHYRMIYQSGNLEPAVSDWTTSNNFVFSKAYTNYYVEVRFDSNDNYLESAYIKSDEVYHYKGEVKVTVICDNKRISYSLYDIKSGDDYVGLGVDVAAKVGYYLSASFEITAVTTDAYDCVVEPSVKYQSYVISNIPDNCELVVTIQGANDSIQSSSTLGPGEIFGDITTDNAIITNDSAFSAAFVVENYNYEFYNELSLKFGRTVPAGTSVIMLDKSNNTFWYYLLSYNATSIPVESFVKMGSTEKYVVDSDKLNLQFVVNFEDTIHLDSTPISVTIGALSNGLQDNLPLFDGEDIKRTVTIFTAEGNINANVTHDSNLTNTFTVTFPTIPESVVSTKWQNRGYSLVLKIKDGYEVPADAYVSLDNNGTSFHYFKDSTYFIIPLDINSTSLGVTLNTALLNGEIKFDAYLYASETLSNTSFINGTELKVIKDVTFRNIPTKLPSLAVNAERDKRVYTSDDDFVAIIRYKDINNYILTANLYYKFDTGYATTGINDEIKIDPNKDSYTYYLDLMNYKQAGNYCFIVNVTENGKVLKSVRYYFIIE